MFHEVIFRRDASAAVALEEPAQRSDLGGPTPFCARLGPDFHLPRSHAIASHIALNEPALMKAAI